MIPAATLFEPLPIKAVGADLRAARFPAAPDVPARGVCLLLNGQTDQMVAFHPPDIVGIPLADIVGKTRNVPLNSDVLATARSLGVTFGDEDGD